MNKVPTRTPERERVFDVIDGERDYLNENSPPSESALSPGESLLLIEAQLSFAKDQWTNEPEGRTATINNIRKIAGLAVRALEILGPIPRENHVPASAGITGELRGRDRGDALARRS